MAKYEVKMTFVYQVETDNLEQTRNSYEFPVFPNLSEEAINFDSSWAEWVELDYEKAGK